MLTSRNYDPRWILATIAESGNFQFWGWHELFFVSFFFFYFSCVHGTKKFFTFARVNSPVQPLPQTTTARTAIAIVTSFPPWHCHWRLHRSEGGGGLRHTQGLWLVVDVNPTGRHVALQQMLEYRDFLLVFEGLGERGEGGSVTDVEATIPSRKPPGGNMSMSMTMTMMTAPQ
jgi:hypothetical protein